MWEALDLGRSRGREVVCLEGTGGAVLVGTVGAEVETGGEKVGLECITGIRIGGLEVDPNHTIFFTARDFWIVNLLNQSKMTEKKLFLKVIPLQHL